MTSPDLAAHLVEWANHHLPGGPFKFDGLGLVPEGQ